MANPGNIQQYLKGVNFPCSKGDLVSKVRENGASDDVTRALQNMPQDMFNNSQEVMKAYEAQI